MADSGAAVNILNAKDYHRIQPRPTQRGANTSFYVAKCPSSTIRTWKTSQELHLIKVAQAAYTTTPADSDRKIPVQQILDDFKNVM